MRGNSSTDHKIMWDNITIIVLVKGAKKMTTLTMNQIQANYRNKKYESGWKRVQIWKLDETNVNVKKQIKIGAHLANQPQDDARLIEEISKYTHDMLQDIPS